ncbi:MAG: class I SAM-dependent methyltransferase [Actinomycetota bacterium]|nr:class I SAM-dependent methyltransferase [Actinomycetota bacterium]
MTTGGVSGAGAFSQATGRVAGEEVGADKPRYRRFQHDLIAPHCGRSVLEAGAGLGEFAETLHGLDRLVVSDIDPEAVAVLRRRFADRPEVQVAQIDVERGLVLDKPVDTVITINTLEHIEDDVEALRSLARLVAPGGNIIAFVPGYEQLYGDFDRKVGHVRRYTPSTLRAGFIAAGLQPTEVRPVNVLGGLAWWAAVRCGGSGSPSSRLVSVYDRVLVPVTRTLERVVRIPFGQSILGVAQVP